MNAYAERVVVTLRRDCTDHVIVLNERHLLRILCEYVDRYYNVARPHLSLEGNAPIPRRRESTPAVRLKATPALGGLHHCYERAAWGRESSIGSELSGRGPCGTHFETADRLSTRHHCPASRCKQVSSPSPTRSSACQRGARCILVHHYRSTGLMVRRHYDLCHLVAPQPQTLNECRAYVIPKLRYVLTRE